MIGGEAREEGEGVGRGQLVSAACCFRPPRLAGPVAPPPCPSPPRPAQPRPPPSGPASPQPARPNSPPAHRLPTPARRTQQYPPAPAARPVRQIGPSAGVRQHDRLRHLTDV